MDAWQWKFHVTGTFVDAAGRALPGRQAIVESGVRDPGPAFDHRGVGPVARSGEDGQFRTWFVTRGDAGEAEPPVLVSLFLGDGPGRWMPLRLQVAEPHGRNPEGALPLHLGAVTLPSGAQG